jgi:hypothetical protein
MSSPVKYVTSTPSGSIVNGNVALGINSIDYGPSSTTGWYPGINPPEGKYVIYETNVSGIPNIYIPNNTTELIAFVVSRGGTAANEAAALQWIAGQSNLFIISYDYPNIVTNGLILLLDAKSVESYPTTGSIWRDLSGQSISGSLINGPTFDPNGWLTFDGIDDYISIPNAYSFTTGNGTDYTFEIWFKMRTLPTIQYGPNGHVWGGQNGNNVVIYLNPQSGGVSKGIMIYDDTRYDPSMMTNGGFTADTWAQWVIIGDGTNNTVTHYINGALDRGPTVVQPSSQYVRAWGYGQTKFGFDTRWNTYSTLDLAIARQYTRQLSQTEISQNYYQGPIVTDGLVFAVDAGNIVSYESGSTTTYSLTGSFTGSLENGVGYLSDNGGTWDFDGTDDRIDFGNVLNFGTTDTFSVSVWFNNSQTLATSNDIYGLVNKYDSNTLNGWTICLRGYSSGIMVRFSTSEGGGQFDDVGLSGVTRDQMSDGNWHNITVTYDNNDLCSVYVDGNLKGTRTYSGYDFTNTKPLSIGSFNYSNIFLNRDKISTTQIYNRALTAEEVSQNFTAKQNRFL